MNNQQKIVCACLQYFTGPACDIDIRPCSNTACLNEGTCTNVIDHVTADFTGYTCNCSYPFYGQNCELKIDLCKNKNCSNHGICQVINSTEVVCKCFSMYEGINCEIESTKLKVTQRVTSAASIIAILTIIMFYLLIVACDVLEIILRCKKKKTAIKVFQKHNYVPFPGDAMRLSRKA